MKIRLLDYAATEHFVEIPDDTEYINGIILSGDIILKHPIYYDTSDCRHTDYYDGEFHINKCDFHKLDKMKRSYDIQLIGTEYEEWMLDSI